MLKKTFALTIFASILASSAAFAAEDPASRMDRIERRMMALEHQTFGGSGSGAAAGDTADLEARLGTMEEQNAKLYGSVEELSRAVEQLAKKVDLIVKDMDLRLQDLEKKSKAQ